MVFYGIKYHRRPQIYRYEKGSKTAKTQESAAIDK
jgi:hypothetical protein